MRRRGRRVERHDDEAQSRIGHGTTVSAADHDVALRPVGRLLRGDRVRPAGDRRDSRSDAGIRCRSRRPGDAHCRPWRVVRRWQLQPVGRRAQRADGDAARPSWLPVPGAGRRLRVHDHARSGGHRHDSQRPVPGAAGADHALRHQRDGAGLGRGHDRSRRSSDAARGADGGCARVPVRRLLGERPELLCRAGLRLRRAGSFQPEHLPGPGWSRDADDARRGDGGGRSRQDPPTQRAVDRHQRPSGLCQSGDHQRIQSGVSAPELRQPGRQLWGRHPGRQRQGGECAPEHPADGERPSDDGPGAGKRAERKHVDQRLDGHLFESNPKRHDSVRSGSICRWSPTARCPST